MSKIKISGIISVKLDSDVRECLEEFCNAERRKGSPGANVLISKGFAAWKEEQSRGE